MSTRGLALTIAMRLCPTRPEGSRGVDSLPLTESSGSFVGRKHPALRPVLAATPAQDFLSGGGEVGERLRALNWSATPLGPPEHWPQSLKTIVRVMLDSRYAMWMLWGSDLTFFCNDAYLPTVGIKRGWVLGARADKVWEEIWPDIGPRISKVLEHGQATWDEALLLFLERSGFPEETYHTFSYSPVYDDTSRIAGMLCVVTEVTERTIGERHLRVLRDLAARASGMESVPQACGRLIGVLGENLLDVPFSCLYLIDDAARLGRLVSHQGNIPERLRPRTVSQGMDDPWRLGAGIPLEPYVVSLAELGAAIPSPLWPEQPIGQRWCCLYKDAGRRSRSVCSSPACHRAARSMTPIVVFSTSLRGSSGRP